MTSRNENAAWFGWAMWLAAASFYSFQFFVRVSPSVMSNELMRSFAVTATALGVLTSSYYLVYAPLQLPLGMFVDKIGPRRLAALSATVCALGCLLFSIADSLPLAQLGRMLMGAGSAAAFLCTLKVVSLWLPPERFSTAAGLSMTIGTIGATSASKPLALLIQDFGWRPTLGAFALLGLAIALLIFLVVKDKKQNSKTLNGGGMLSGLKEVISNPQCWIIAVYTLLMYTPMGVFGDMWGVPYFMERFGINCVNAAMPASMLYLGIVVGAPLMSYISNTLQSRKTPLLITSVSILSIFTFLLHGPDVNLTVASGLIFIAGVALGGQMLAFTVVCELNKIRLSGTAIGFNNTICMLSGVLFQPCVGFVLDLCWAGNASSEGVRQYSAYSYNCGLSIIPLCALIATFLTFFLKETFHLIHDKSRME